MRPRRVAAGVVLIAALALVVVPGAAGMRPPSREQSIAAEAFERVVLAPEGGAATAILSDPSHRSAGPMDASATLSEPVAIDPAVAASPVPRPAVAPTTSPTVSIVGTTAVASTGGFRYDPELSWYGPGFYGQHTACGQTLTTTLLGVANRTLPCGTLVTFKWGSKVVTVPVVDRGPYVSGRQWDLTKATCMALDHCFTGPIYWRYG